MIEEPDEPAPAEQSARSEDDPQQFVESKNDSVWDVCDRCGSYTWGRYRWMFHSGTMPRKEFFCNRCQRVLRVYAIIGLSLLAILLSGFVLALWWLGALR
jgi:hypothetical protein